jgi:hypothetical protein
MRFARMAAIGISLAAGVTGALLLSPGAQAAHDPHKDGAAEAAAKSFLATLPPEMRATASFSFDSPQRSTWYFVPRERAGVPLLNLDDRQAELLGPLLATALSPEGLLEARGVMKHENILRKIETQAGVDATRRDPGLYYTSVFGTPASATPWGWRFEGHHLSLNVTLLPGQAPVVAPLFIGANPAKVPSGLEAGFRLLGAEEDLGRALITMLPAERRKQAMLSDTAFPDIVSGNDPKVRPLALEGLAAADMNADEQRALHRLIELYTGRVNAASAREMLARIEHAGFGKVRFGWAGGVEPGQKHYYRVHGPTLLIEYDNTQNDANHVHTVYRDLERDFGGDALRQHLASAHLSTP